MRCDSSLYVSVVDEPMHYGGNENIKQTMSDRLCGLGFFPKIHGKTCRNGLIKNFLEGHRKKKKEKKRRRRNMSHVYIESRNIEHAVRDGNKEYGLIRHAGASGIVTKRSWYLKTDQGHWKQVHANQVPLAVRYGVPADFSAKQQRHIVSSVRTAGSSSAPHHHHQEPKKNESPTSVIRRLTRKLYI